MNAAEIILLILGFLSISISFFVGKKDRNSDSPETAEYQSRDIWTEKEETMVREQIEAILREEKENVIADTTDQLNRKSNEKIMEFDEFSAQLMEKINHNHEEVVFMYNMLNEKEKELKEAAAKKGPAEKSSGIDAVEQINRQALKAVDKKSAKPAVDKTRKPKTVTGAKPQAGKPETEKSGKLEDGSVNKKIIEMYKQGKSVLEISKELDIGQGEVKLMISLYGGNK
ncbi:MAG: hypothetical protein HFG34_07925 [Eubacterium sp.]|nr:hypothetical protein [Eubacterium sp.]